MLYTWVEAVREHLNNVLGDDINDMADDAAIAISLAETNLEQVCTGERKSIAQPNVSLLVDQMCSRCMHTHDFAQSSAEWRQNAEQQQQQQQEGQQFAEEPAAPAARLEAVRSRLVSGEPSTERKSTFQVRWYIHTSQRNRKWRRRFHTGIDKSAADAGWPLMLQAHLAPVTFEEEVAAVMEVLLQENKVS